MQGRIETQMGRGLPKSKEVSIIRFVGLDPSTRTGFCALDQQGNVLVEKELTGQGKEDPKRIITLEDELYRHLQEGDQICIEGFPFGTQKAVTTGWIHGGLRGMIYRKGLSYDEVAPNAVKKYVAVSGWVDGEAGKKRRLKDKEKKEAVRVALLEHFGYTHKSDNVRDAYILARIALNLYRVREFLPELDINPYQREVIKAILKPE